MRLPLLDLDRLRHNSPNLSIWLDYTEPFFTPDSMRVLGWLFCVGASLQRRVWFGNLDYKPLFCNPYMLLIGVPACGKGLVQDEVPKILEFHKDPTVIPAKGRPPATYITMGPDNFTYEAAVDIMCQNTKRVTYLDKLGKKQEYISSPLALNLTEIETMFKKHAEAVGTLLRQAYDCIDHRYDTKTQGRYFVKNSCVSLLAGTQPGRLPKLSKLDAFTDGMASRCIMCFEPTPKVAGFHLGEPPEPVKALHANLVQHIGFTIKLFGKLQYHKTTYDWLEVYYRDHISPKLSVSDERMQNFYSRWRANCLKLAAAFHFSESIELVIAPAAFEKTIHLLEYLEGRAMEGLAGIGSSDNAHVQSQILVTVRQGGKDGVRLASIVQRHMADLKEIKDVFNILNLLKAAGKVKEPKVNLFVATELPADTAVAAPAPAQSPASSSPETPPSHEAAQ